LKVGYGSYLALNPGSEKEWLGSCRAGIWEVVFTYGVGKVSWREESEEGES